jgi:hypothetical protein
MMCLLILERLVQNELFPNNFSALIVFGLAFRPPVAQAARERGLVG